MDQDNSRILEPILANIGEEAAEIIGSDLDGLYLYGEVEDGSQFASLFKDEGEVARYHGPSQRLFQLLDEAWRAENSDEGKRWTVIEYEVTGTRFDVRFTYPEQLDPNEHCSERCSAAVRKRFGNKPVIYPSIPGEFREMR